MDIEKMIIEYLQSIGFENKQISVWQKEGCILEVSSKAIRFYSKNGMMLGRFQTENKTSLNSLFFVMGICTFYGLDKEQTN